MLVVSTVSSPGVADVMTACHLVMVPGLRRMLTTTLLARPTDFSVSLRAWVSPSAWHRLYFGRRHSGGNRADGSP
jgi:hypothetical protein